MRLSKTSVLDGAFSVVFLIGIALVLLSPIVYLLDDPLVSRGMFYVGGSIALVGFIYSMMKAFIESNI